MGARAGESGPVGNAASRTGPDAGGETKAAWLQVEVVGKTGD